MKIIETPIPGCYEIRPKVFSDDRGLLVKTFHHDSYEKFGLRTDFKEEYYSVSKKGVLRGLHFQLPPHDHVKCVTCVSGHIFDVVVDLRVDSPTYKNAFTIQLKSEIGNMLYIPSGLAHGFYVLSDNAIFLNRTTSVYSPEYDFGIKWSSCKIEWPDLNPSLSEKDKNMITLSEFSSPFNFS